MSNLIHKSFKQEFPITITPAMVKDFDRVVTMFELRGDHPLTLNSPLLGVYKIGFSSDQDRKALFDIVGYDEFEFVRVIKNITSINKDFRVVSDAFNLLSIWLLHLTETSKLSSKLKKSFTMNLLKYLQYKFFTSVVNNSFPHGANREVMQNMYESLTLKFGIREHGDWKTLIERRTLDLLKKHERALKKFEDDDAVLLFISDTQTKLRNQIVKFANVFYEFKKEDNFIKSVSSTAELDGNKILKDVAVSHESIGYVVFAKTLNESSFIVDGYINALLSLYNWLNYSIVKKLLLAFISVSKEQKDKSETTKVVKKKDGTRLLIGNEILIEAIVSRTYTSASLAGVQLNNKLAIFKHAKRLFTVHKEKDVDLNNIKATIEDFIRRTNISKRDSTIGSLIILFCLYIVLMSFDHYKKRR